MRLLAPLILIAAIANLALPARAQDNRASGTLGKILSTDKITLGVRDSALPFSFRLPDGSHAGYAVSLCREIVQDIVAALGGKPVTIVYRSVTPESRIGLVVSGAVDLECGTTSRNAQRQQVVAFSPVFFVAGTKLLVSRQSPIRSHRDLPGKTVVVTAGTTGEAAMHVLVDQLLLRMRIVTAPENAEAFAMVREGKADAFATDDVVLAGIAATRVGADYHVVGDYLSYEPYGLMYRKDDPAFASVIESGFRRLAASRRLTELYDRWLIERLPTGEMLNIPPSPELTQIFRSLGLPD